MAWFGQLNWHVLHIMHFSSLIMMVFGVSYVKNGSRTYFNTYFARIFSAFGTINSDFDHFLAFIEKIPIEQIKLFLVFQTKDTKRN